MEMPITIGSYPISDVNVMQNIQSSSPEPTSGTYMFPISLSNGYSSEIPVLGDTLNAPSAPGPSEYHEPTESFLSLIGVTPGSPLASAGPPYLTPFPSAASAPPPYPEDGKEDFKCFVQNFSSTVCHFSLAFQIHRLMSKQQWIMKWMT